MRRRVSCSGVQGLGFLTVMFCGLWGKESAGLAPWRGSPFLGFEVQGVL